MGSWLQLPTEYTHARTFVSNNQFDEIKENSEKVNVILLYNVWALLSLSFH